MLEKQHVLKNQHHSRSRLYLLTEAGMNEQAASQTSLTARAADYGHHLQSRESDGHRGDGKFGRPAKLLCGARAVARARRERPPAAQAGRATLCLLADGRARARQAL